MRRTEGPRGTEKKLEKTQKEAKTQGYSKRDVEKRDAEKRRKMQKRRRDTGEGRRETQRQAKKTQKHAETGTERHARYTKYADDAERGTETQMDTEKKQRRRGHRGVSLRLCIETQDDSDQSRQRDAERRREGETRR